jgi:hypothetical protein
MNDEVIQPKKPRVTWLQVIVGVTALLLLASLALPAFSRTCARGNITKGISNARQIVMALKLYASDHDGKYPDAALADSKNANEVFRLLFKEETIDSEVVFGCPLSPFVPDGNIGSDEERSKALEAGENHWAITIGVSDAKSGDIPLVFENPLSATWPPKWNANAVEQMQKGRAWKTGVIMGMNDGGAQIVPLVSKRGNEVGLKPDRATGKNIFEAAIDSKEFPEGKVLDVDNGDL